MVFFESILYVVCSDNEELVHWYYDQVQFFLDCQALRFKSLLFIPGIQPSTGEWPDDVLQLVAVPQKHEEKAEPRVDEQIGMVFVISW